MIADKRFDIPLAGLKSGHHTYKFKIDDLFFNDLEFSVIRKGNIELELLLEKVDNEYFMEFKLVGNVNLQCDRCSEYFNKEINNSYKLIFKADNRYSRGEYDNLEGKDNEENIELPEQDDVRFITDSHARINIGQDIYDFINLSVPMNIVHEEDKCSGEMLNILTKFSPENTNGTGEANDNEKPLDPRWNDLIKLK